MQENTNVKPQEALRPLILEFDEVKWLKKKITPGKTRARHFLTG